jgi:hypothetical protein
MTSSGLGVNNVIFVVVSPHGETAFVKCRCAWVTEESELESQLGKKIILLHVVQTGSGVHPTSYTMGTGGSFPGVKAAGA